ncbi:MAG: hypothetical protein L0215_06420 [Gemmataceae bacterium]|nr:hypothetical protein [Gemmataceae bacterium]
MEKSRLFLAILVVFVGVRQAHPDEIKFDPGYPNPVDFLQIDFKGTYKLDPGDEFFAVELIAVFKTDLTNKVTGRDDVTSGMGKWTGTLKVNKGGTWLVQAILVVRTPEFVVKSTAKTEVVEVIVKEFDDERSSALTRIEDLDWLNDTGIRLNGVTRFNVRFSDLADNKSRTYSAK